MLETERIVAVGLLTAKDLAVLGVGFTRAYRVEDAPCFNELLRAIDEADREFYRDADRRRGH